MKFNHASNVALGIDVVSIQRIQNLLQNHPRKFRKFAFTENEQRYCDRQPRPAQHYAGRWTIKEAFIKSISIQDINPDLTSIEVNRTPTLHLELEEEARDLINRTAVAKEKQAEDVDIAISLAHDEKADIAIGIVILLF